MPLSPTQTRELLDRIGHAPRRKLGQNFLVDGNIVRKSLELADVQSGDRVVEIGPGLGTLTAALLNTDAEVFAVEYDRSLFAHLQETTDAPRLTLLHADAVDEPLAGLQPGDASFKIVANLPYAIATPWMERVLAGPLPECLVLMLQKECADRFCATAGNKNYGAISIFLEAAFTRLPGHTVARTCFYPAPDVDSVLLHLKRKPDAVQLSQPTRKLIRELFTQRRKQLGSLVRSRADAEPRLLQWLDALTSLEIRTTSRPEAVPLEGWLALENCLS